MVTQRHDGGSCFTSGPLRETQVQRIKELAAVKPTGFAFLIVGIAYLVIAAVLYVAGRNELKTVNPVPQQTAETVKEDVQWAKQQLS